MLDYHQYFAWHLLDMLRRATRNVAVPFAAAVATTSLSRPYFFLTPHLSLCSSSSTPEEDKNRDTDKKQSEDRNKGINFFDMLDKVKNLSATQSPADDEHPPVPSPSSSPSSSSSSSPFSSFDDYTISIMNDLKLSLDKHESNLREQAAQTMQTVLQTLTLTPGQSNDSSLSSPSSYDLLDLVPASILDDGSKTALRDLSGVCERITSDFKSTVTHFDHPFLVRSIHI